MVSHADRRDAGAVEKLEDVHAYEHLRHDKEYIALRNEFGSCEGGVECGVHESHVDEGIRGHDQDEDLGGPSNMVVNEAPAGRLVHRSIDLSIHCLHEEALENVEANDEVVYTDDAQYEGAEGSQARDGF